MTLGVEFVRYIFGKAVGLVKGFRRFVDFNLTIRDAR